jgi:serine/threonine protein kinase
MKKSCGGEYMAIKNTIQHHILEQKRLLAREGFLMLARTKAQKRFVILAKEYPLHVTSSCNGCSRSTCVHCLLTYPRNLQSSRLTEQLHERRMSYVKEKLLRMEQASKKKATETLTSLCSSKKKRRLVPLPTILETKPVAQTLDECIMRKEVPLSASSDKDPRHECKVYDTIQAYGGHPNILKKVQHYSTSTSLVILLEHADGGEYKKALVQNRFQPCTLQQHFIEIASAQKFLHSCGYSNLKLSLENILLHNNKPQIVDFSLSLPISEPCFGFHGKELYTAPELWQSDQKHRVPCDPAAVDTWALGIILFMMISGEKPFNRALSFPIHGADACPIFKFVSHFPGGFAQGMSEMIGKRGLWPKFRRFGEEPHALNLLLKLLQLDPA